MSLYVWVLFHVFILGMLALDLGVFKRKAHIIQFKEALFWSGWWISLALLFNGGLYFFMGREAALDFLAGYLIEKALSIDNIFVFIMLFKAFQVPKAYYRRVLVWGILGALVMRAFFIFGGVALVQRFHVALYLLGGFLIFSGIRLLFPKREQMVDPEKQPLLRFLGRWIPVTKTFVEDHFFVFQNGKWCVTPLFVTLIFIEITDVLFALDSIPAIMGITLNPFIIYTSNVFAILGLRSIFFVVSGGMELLHYLHYALASILVFIGVKLLIAPFVKISIPFTLAFISISIALSIIAPLCISKEQAH